MNLNNTMIGVAIPPKKKKVLSNVLVAIPIYGQTTSIWKSREKSTARIVQKIGLKANGRRLHMNNVVGSD